MTSTIEQVRTHETPTTVDVPPQSHRRSGLKLLGWTAFGAGLVMAAGISLMAVTSDAPSSKPVGTDQAPTQTSLRGVPRSADAAERYLAARTPTAEFGVPRSADAAERYLAARTPTAELGVPRSADAAERYLAHH